MSDEHLKAVMQHLGGIFEDYTKPAAAILREVAHDRFTMTIRWGDFQISEDVTSVVTEALSTGKLTVGGDFEPVVQRCIVSLAREIVQKADKTAKADDKRQRRAAKILRLAKGD